MKGEGFLSVNKMKIKDFFIMSTINESFQCEYSRVSRQESFLLNVFNTKIAQVEKYVLNSHKMTQLSSNMLRKVQLSRSYI